MSKSLKILYVTTAFCSPPHTGCAIRTMNIARQLKKQGQVTILAVSRFFDEGSVELAKNEFNAVHCVKLRDYHERNSVFSGFLKKWHMHWPLSHGLQAAPADQKRFEQLLSQHDTVWFHTLLAAFPFSCAGGMPPSVMDLDDLNQCKYDLRSGYDKTSRLRLSAKVQSFKWKRHEMTALKQYDVIAVCSRRDKDYLGGDHIHVIPNGFNPPSQKPAWQIPDPNRLGFIGTLGYGPNREGLVWFRDRIWPLIRKQNPNLKLRLIGSPPPPQYAVHADGFEHLGYVQDAAAEIAAWSAMIVPITYGGGTRIKIVEAFSKLCPVVSTSAGAYGIDGVHNEHFLLADEPGLFAEACCQLSGQPEVGRRLAENAWTLFNEKYTWDVIGRSIRSIVETIIKNR